MRTVKVTSEALENANLKPGSFVAKWNYHDMTCRCHMSEKAWRKYQRTMAVSRVRGFNLFRNHSRPRRKVVRVSASWAKATLKEWRAEWLG